MKIIKNGLFTEILPLGDVPSILSNSLDVEIDFFDSLQAII